MTIHDRDGVPIEVGCRVRCVHTVNDLCEPYIGDVFTVTGLIPIDWDGTPTVLGHRLKWFSGDVIVLPPDEKAPGPAIEIVGVTGPGKETVR